MDKNIKQVIKREYLKCAKDPIHFMRKYCTIQHGVAVILVPTWILGQFK